ncbi:hypothetical protein LJR034_005186 [Caballeronia sp. LjRoot34]|uniref:hypothetical protein n=1 Tax=Caballeronia sp. LjRoot34 TaxID=3342325 RepID=UPI003ED14392
MDVWDSGLLGASGDRILQLCCVAEGLVVICACFVLGSAVKIHCGDCRFWLFLSALILCNVLSFTPLIFANSLRDAEVLGAVLLTNLTLGELVCIEAICHAGKPRQSASGASRAMSDERWHD